MESLACVTSSLASPGAAARLWGAAERLWEEIGTRPPPAERSLYERRVAVARSAMADDAAFARAWEEGRAMTLEQAVEYALAKPDT